MDKLFQIDGMGQIAIRYSSYLGDFYRKIKQKKSAGNVIIATTKKFLKKFF